MIASDACAPRSRSIEDVLLAVKERARREHRSAGAVLSDLVRQALTAQPRGGGAPRGRASHGFEPFPHRAGAISNALIDRLREEEAV